jgi:hypothetical protein
MTGKEAILFHLKVQQKKEIFIFGISVFIDLELLIFVRNAYYVDWMSLKGILTATEQIFRNLLLSERLSAKLYVFCTVHCHTIK